MLVCCGLAVSAIVRTAFPRTKRFLEIGMLLVQDPHLLLLDEPAAGMTDAETEYTAELFRTRQASIR